MARQSTLEIALATPIEEPAPTQHGSTAAPTGDEAAISTQDPAQRLLRAAQLGDSWRAAPLLGAPTAAECVASFGHCAKQDPAGAWRLLDAAGYDLDLRHHWAGTAIPTSSQGSSTAAQDLCTPGRVWTLAMDKALIAASSTEAHTLRAVLVAAPGVLSDWSGTSTCVYTCRDTCPCRGVVQCLFRISLVVPVQNLVPVTMSLSVSSGLKCLLKPFSVTVPRPSATVWRLFGDCSVTMKSPSTALFKTCPRPCPPPVHSS